MEKFTYQELATPPTDLPPSPHLTKTCWIDKEKSTYIFTANRAGQEKACALIKSCIDFVLSTGGGTQDSHSDFGSEAHRARVIERFSLVFELGGSFHMQDDLERNLGATNLPPSRIARHDDVVIFDLNFFNPCDEIEKEEIEAQLDLERLITGVTVSHSFGRVGTDERFYAIPLTEYVTDAFPVMHDPDLLSQIGSELKSGLYRYPVNYDDNQYFVVVGLANIDRTMMRYMTMSDGKCVGPAVGQYCSLPGTNNFFTWQTDLLTLYNRMLDKEKDLQKAQRLEAHIKQLQTGDKRELHARFKESLTHDIESLDHSVRLADRRYSGDGVTKTRVSEDGGFGWVYLVNPQLELSLELDRNNIGNYFQAISVLNGFHQRFQPHSI